jgi:hypothetical protein
MSIALPPYVGGEEYPARKDRRFAFEPSDNAERDSYRALSRLYGLFSLGADQVKFTSNDRIDSDAFLEYVKTHQ